VIAEIQDPATDPADARRFYLNQLVAGQHAAVDPRRWAELGQPSRNVEDGARVGLGFDGSISQDATALVACTEDGHVFVPVVDGRSTVWLRPVNAPAGWRMPRQEIEAAVAAVHDRYDIGLMLCDPPKWQTEIERWAELYGDDKVLFFDTNQPKRMSGACDRFSTALAEGSLSHDADPLLTGHVLAMVRKKAYVKSEDESDGRTRYVFTKGEDRRKIDAGVAAVLALEAAMTMPEVPPAREPVFAWA
jgi:phage terminase large subunit-like protein